MLFLFALELCWVPDLLEMSYLLTLETDCVKIQTDVAWEIWTSARGSLFSWIIHSRDPSTVLERVKNDCLHYAGRRLVLGPRVGSLK